MSEIAVNISFYCLVSGSIYAQANEGYPKFQGRGGLKIQDGVGLEEGGEGGQVMRMVWVF